MWSLLARSVAFLRNTIKEEALEGGGRMKIQGLVHHHQHHHLHHNHRRHFHGITSAPPTCYDVCTTQILKTTVQCHRQMLRICTMPATLGGLTTTSKRLSTISTSAALQPSQPLDLTEDNIRQVLADAREEFGHLFDASIGMTGQVDLAELDGPFVKISLKGRFWHERSVVLARLANYMKQRIPEILEVDIEDEKQLDDSPANF